MNKVLVVSISLLYLLLLFAIAYFIEHRRKAGRSYVKNAWVYALALAVYCTGWTYYGSVGRATTSGIGPSAPDTPTSNRKSTTGPATLW